MASHNNPAILTRKSAKVSFRFFGISHSTGLVEHHLAERDHCFSSARRSQGHFSGERHILGTSGHHFGHLEHAETS